MTTTTLAEENIAMTVTYRHPAYLTPVQQRPRVRRPTWRPTWRASRWASDRRAAPSLPQQSGWADPMAADVAMLLQRSR